MTLDWGALIGGVATAAAAGGGLVLTARQIRLSRENDERANVVDERNNRWRRVELVRVMTAQLDADDEVQFCLRALDWGVGPLPIPARHRSLFPDKIEIMEQDTEKMERALQVSLDKGWRDPEFLVYRHSFDRFFTEIETFIIYGRRLGEEFIEDMGLTYYVRLIRKPPYLHSDDGASPLKPFIAAFYEELHKLIWPNG